MSAFSIEAQTIVALGSAAITACAIVFMRKRRQQSTDSLSSLASFVLEEVLTEGELTVLLGHFSWQPMDEKSLVELSASRVPLASGLVASLELALSSYSGAEYAYYKGRSSLSRLITNPELRAAFALEVISPASEKQIARSRPQPGSFVIETPGLYNAVVAPYISSLDPRSVSWIEKVLDLSKERERVLHNNTDAATGFLLNVDTKWKTHPDCNVPVAARASWRDHDAVKDLYCLAICHRRDIRSLRDLKGEHLPLLRNILTSGTQTVCQTYGVTPSQLRIFVHYQPQFYHFHVHFTRLHNDLGCQVERAHLLHDIIEHLEADGDYYARTKTLYYQLKENDKLLAKVREYMQAEAKAGAATKQSARRQNRSPARQ
jgi:m7GpppX diphosphatase